MNALKIAQFYIHRILVNKRAWFLTFVLPTAVVLMIMITTITSVVPVVVWYDEDQSVWSKQLKAQLEERFEVVQAASIVELEQSAEKSGFGVFIPASYSESLMNSSTLQVDMYQKNLSEQSALVKLALEQFVQEQQRFLADMGKVEQGQQLSAESKEKLYTEYLQARPVLKMESEKSSSSVSMRIAMGIFLMFIFMNGLQAVSVMIEDRHNRTMLRAYAAPVRNSEISFGYFLGAFANGTIQVAVVLVIVHLVLGARISTSIVEQFLLLELYLLAILGALCMISTFLTDMKRFTQVGYGIIVPTCMIGGCFWPVYIMEPYMQRISYYVPQRWVLDALDKLEAGASLNTVVLPIGVLLLFTIIFLGVGVSAFRPATREG
ncbi:ABC transporter permease [Paenibacillus sp. SC116]|uniref:ABC transporter permease n=1 Tax=Paenibacillus sp. SC116 TaxID=2968986 RepID=UPI00215A9035|nr:ABC transporter permease [Paenibacillus sp. SC116]MCR8844229.1 ABC transporter permease [Paenibacillus sp. SC116]